MSNNNEGQMLEHTPKEVQGYHFTGSTLRNGQPIPEIGKWLKHEGNILVCSAGLHASLHPSDALQYASGNLLHKVILRTDLVSHGYNGKIDKYVGRERKILDSIQAEKLLRDFARWSALRVVHLWRAPEIVKRYLNTGDENLRAAAWAAAGNAARDTAQAAARDAAWYAARDTAQAAARDAAWYAARDAAWYAAWAAAQDVARDTAWYTPQDAAWAAARAASRAEFAVRVNEAFQNKDE